MNVEFTRTVTLWNQTELIIPFPPLLFLRRFRVNNCLFLSPFLRCHHNNFGIEHYCCARQTVAPARSRMSGAPHTVDFPTDGYIAHTEMLHQSNTQRKTRLPPITLTHITTSPLPLHTQHTLLHASPSSDHCTEASTPSAAHHTQASIQSPPHLTEAPRPSRISQGVTNHQHTGHHCDLN